ncbi:hypothetical protein [Hwangdonia lutea]|uniref:Uncharacterized protein n=1 Tax=Hwangdonia lutea TaxID=3075823 RepID=A0AA97EME1_9FLAO|nr:hypothetical protein [Hwangdonia sp. SCSIO 19198]WOD43852.1 hypothetical protein RNZ46_01005 [Hwangdonia sp. SCSIO 19198]
MAHNMIKPFSFLMYFLALIAFFFLGLIYAGITEAGKGQMLAGGAIVFGYGVIAAFIGLCIALILGYSLKRHFIIKINVLLTLIIAASFAYFTIKYQKRQKEKEQHKIEHQQSKRPTAPAENKIAKPIAMLAKNTSTFNSKSPMGLGMFIPNFHENKTLYFYGNLTQGKSVQEHMPVDSITFKQREYGGFDIATAPPWLVPDHLKLDYDMLYFKVQSISHDFIEVTVNTTNNQTSFVDRYAGKLMYWPEFLLGINSVEFPNPENHNIYARPFDAAGTINTPYSFMRPLKVTDEWMYVALLDDDFKNKGHGWIRWKKQGKMLITYSLLS